MRLPPSMLEATRLTREGRLSEAAALLRGLLVPAPTSAPVGDATILRHQPARLPGTAAPIDRSARDQRILQHIERRPAEEHERMAAKPVRFF